MEYKYFTDTDAELNWTLKGWDKKGKVKIEKYFVSKEKGLEFASETKLKGITGFSLKSTSCIFMKWKRHKKRRHGLSRKLSFKD